MAFTPEILGMNYRDEEDFAKFSEASADTFRSRIVALMTGWSPAVVDSVTGRKAINVVVDLSSVMVNRISEFKLIYTAVFRCRVGTES